MVISWITRSLATQRAHNTVYIDNVKDLWEDLEEKFAKSNNFHVSDLLQEINSIKQSERSVIDYYTNSKILWEELDSLRHLHVCVYKAKCSCGLMTIMGNYRESECIMCFLKDLGETYNTVKTQILLIELFAKRQLRLLFSSPTRKTPH